MSAIEFSARAAENLDEPSLGKSEKKKILDAIQRARERPAEYLTTETGYGHYRIDVDGEYVAIVDWDENEDRIRLLSVGSRDDLFDQ